VGPGYSSPIPEPFTFVPDSNRTIALADGSITSPFLVRFGRPSRDTGLLSERSNQPSDEQALYLLNSSDVRKRIDSSPVLRPVYNLPKARRAEQVRLVYFILLARFPTEEEQNSSRPTRRLRATRPGRTDLAWALINGKEFLYRH